MRILLVEDEPAALWVLEKALREHAYAVDAATTGKAALAQALALPYDLVLLDLMLPDTDGLAVCRELRRRRCAAPVLMLTARDAVEERVAGLDSGADDYLVKPFDLDELLARVRALMRRGPALQSDTIKVGDLAVLTRSREVRRAGARVELTAREYGVLEYLARRAGQVVSRQELLDHVWPGTLEPESNVVEVYVRKLRLKIERGRGPRLLRTRRGHGYMLASP